MVIMLGRSGSLARAPLNDNAVVASMPAVNLRRETTIVPIRKSFPGLSFAQRRARDARSIGGSR